MTKPKSTILACRKTGENKFETDVQLPDGRIVTTHIHTGSFSHIKGELGTCDISFYDARTFYQADNKLIAIAHNGQMRLVKPEVIAEHLRLKKIADDYLAENLG